MSLTSRGHFKIGTTEFAAMSIRQTNESLASEDSGRTDDGVMHISWVKPKLRKWEIELPPCSPSTVSSLFQLVQGKEYDLTIFDTSTNSESTVHCYTSNTQSDCYSGVLKVRNSSSVGIYQGVSFSAIEVG